MGIRDSPNANPSALLSVKSQITMVGALEVDTRMFIVTLAACRLLRFGLEAALAIVYGRSILRWLDSDLFHDLVSLFIVVAVVGTTLSMVKLVRATGRKNRVMANG